MSVVEKGPSLLAITHDDITKKIYAIRDQQVMLDRDLAQIYGVETKIFNQAVKRNAARFPERFRFQLTDKEFDILRLQIVTSRWGGRRYKPYAFLLFQRIDQLEKQQLDTDAKFEKVFQAIEDKSNIPRQGIFFDGQVFEAYCFASDLIRSAKSSIVLIDNYVDDSVLTVLAKRKPKVSAIIYTKSISKHLMLDLEKHNVQYPQIFIKKLKTSHDRFSIIDNKDVYHIGASLKDLGKRWFAFSKIEKDGLKILGTLKAL